MSEPLVIVGTGLAGCSVAREFRRRDSATPIVMLSADDGRIYAKPMLSNALAAGRTPASLATADAAGLAGQLRAEVHADTRVTAIDRVAGRVLTDRGGFAYGRLVLALGADPVRLPLTGDAADRVWSVNDLTDYTRLRAALTSAARVVVLGAGLIGCEFANDLAATGHRVTVLDPAAWPLSRLLPQALGQAWAARLAAAGVEWRLGRSARAVDHADGGVRVALDDGSTLDADVVLSAVGLRPRTALADRAGLAAARGIVVDRWLRTHDPRIFALGDCAEVDGEVLPYVMPLMHGARALAATLAGTSTPMPRPPMPVVVKTPASPLVVLPPPPAIAVRWTIAASPDVGGAGEPSPAGDGLEASALDADGRLRGFALLGQAVGRRQALVARIAAVTA